MEPCLTCKICCRFPERYSPLIPFFMGKERGSYYGCRIDVIKYSTARLRSILLREELDALSSSEQAPRYSRAVIKSGDGYICPYFLPEKNRCSIYEKRPLDCRLYPFMVTYDDSYKKVILVLDNHCPYPNEFAPIDPIEITEQDIGFINDPQPNTTFVKELPKLTEFVFGKEGRFRKLKLEDGHIIPYLWKDIMNVLYEENTGEAYYNFKQYPSNDYIYLKRDLVELKGDRYKDKRNLCNYFQKNYSYKIDRLSPSEEHLNLYKRWAGKDADTYQRQLMEDSFFFHRRAFIDYNKLGLDGIEIKIDNRLAAYTFGFGSSDAFYILGEIADQSYKGINQFIFREFCRVIPDNYTYINTLDDSEIEGLRINKLSYRPITNGGRICQR